MTAPANVHRLLLLGGSILLGRRGSIDIPGGEKGRALLARLACEPAWHNRDSIANLLWPDAPEPRANLRQALLSLSGSEKKLGKSPPLLLTNRDSLRFNHAQWEVDALELAAELPGDIDIAALEHRISLYRGDFLPGPAPAACPGYQEWLELQRESLRLRVLNLTEILFDAYATAGFAPNTLLPLALRCITIDPWRETGQRRLMALYAADGQSVAACRQYETFARQLQEELGITPEAETQQLYAQVQTRQQVSLYAPRVPTALPGRRLLTVLSCEFASADISADSDPEQWQARLAAPQRTAIALASRFGGHVRQACDGELLIYFGYPLVQENAARQALRAALAIQRELGEESSLEIHMGVHSGVVITTTDGMLQGPTPRQALRLRALAQNEIVVSPASATLTRGYFVFEPWAETFAADDQAPPAYRLLAETGATHRLEAAERLTPLHGRDKELAVLQEEWRRVADQQDGERCRVVLLEGEAGVGKSRLLLSFKEALAVEQPLLRELRCDVESQETPYYPLILTLRAVFGFEHGDDVARQGEKIAAYLAAKHPQAPADTLAMLKQLLGLPPAAGSTNMPPQTFRNRVLALIPWLLSELTRQRPLLMLIDDVHWLDDSTWEILGRCIEHQPAPNALILLASRPLPAGQNYPLRSRRLALKGLPDVTMGSLVHTLAPYLDDDARQHIVSRAEGIPFFAEEMIRLADRGEAVPATLHDLFAVRFDRSGSACQSAQLAACIGRRFSRALLQRSAPPEWTPERIDDDLRTLAALHLLQAEDDDESSDNLAFHHALLQEAAYAMQTEAQRQQHHAAIAACLQKDFPELAQKQPEMVARHLTAAATTDVTSAIHWWLRAGQQAANQFAHREAQAHLHNGLKLLPRLTGNDASAQADLESQLLIHLARSEQCLVGYGRGRTLEWLIQAIHLQQHGAGDPATLFSTLWGMWEASFAQSTYTQALEIAQQLMALATHQGRQTKHPGLLIQAHYAKGVPLFWQGNYPAAEKHLRQVVALDTNPDPATWTRDLYGRILRLSAQGYLLLLLDTCGQESTAQALVPQLLAEAELSKDPMTIAFVGSLVVGMFRRQGNIAEVQRLAEAHLATAQAAHSLVFAPFFSMLLQWAAGMRGNPAPLAASDRILAGIQAAMANIRPSFLILLAEIQHRHGDDAAALDNIELGLQYATQCGQGHHNPELLCLRGHCLLTLERLPAALKAYREALHLSQKHGALAPALVAATALSEHASGKAGHDARRTLRSLLANYQPAAHSADFLRAQALLANEH